MPLSDYNKKKNLEVTSQNDSNTTQDKAQPVLVKGEEFFKEQDEFEDGNISSNPAWSIENPDATATVQDNTILSGQKSLKLERDSGGGLQGVVHDRGSNDSVSDGDVYTCLINTGNTVFSEYELYNSGEADLVKASFDNGNIVIETSQDNGKTIGSYQSNTLYRVELKLFPSKSEALLTVKNSSGNVVAKGKTQNGTTGASNLQFVRLFGGGPVYFDDVSYNTNTVGFGTQTESDTGTGDIVVDFTNIADAQDIAVYDQDGNLLDYEIEDLDTTAETATLWVYKSWTRDDTVQAQIAYGNNTADGLDASENNIASLNDVDGLQKADFNGDGDTDVVAVSGSNGGVFWYEQGNDPNTWTEHTIFSNGTFGELEGVDAKDIDGDGKVEVFILDQSNGDLIIAKQDGSDPTGTWSSTVLDSTATNAQCSLIRDIDDDGNDDIIYTYEGSSAGNGGVFWQEWNGSDPTNATNWTKHTIRQIEGAWWIAQDRKDLSGDGNATDIVCTVREAKNSAASGELFWLEPPSDPTNTWTSNQIEDNSEYVPLHCDFGELKGNGHGKDVIAGAYDSGTGVYIYNFSNNFSRETLKSDLRWEQAAAVSLSSGGRDQIVLNDFDDTNELRLLQWNGKIWQPYFKTGYDKSDDRVITEDFDGDGTGDILINAADDGEIDWFETLSVEGIDRQAAEATWNNTNQNAEFVQHLNESSAPLLDSTNNDNDSNSITGTTVLEGQFGNARNFDGTGDEIDFTNNGNLEITKKLTLIAWVNKDSDGSTDSNARVLAKLATDTGEHYHFLQDNFSASNSGMRLRLESDAENKFGVTETQAIQTDTWTRYAGDFNPGTEARIFKNGSVDNTATTSVSTLEQGNNEDIRLGQRSGNYWGGLIDEVRIYTDVKTTDWHQGDYDASPKAGQVYFRQQAAEDTAIKTSLQEAPSLADSTFSQPVKSLQESVGVGSTITDYNNVKNLRVTSQNDSGTTQNKAQPVLIKGGVTYDVSTAEFTDSFDVSSQDNLVYGVAFNDTGSKMFVAGSTNDSIYEYFLSTNFDVSTASFTDSFDVSSQDTFIRGVAFNDTGSKMFVVGGDNNNIYEYFLSTNFDVSTASFTDSFDVSSQDSAPEGVAFNDTGSKMFVVGSINDSIYEYFLSTNFDVSTASFTDSFDVSSQDSGPEGVAFNDTGSKMFVVGSTNDNIYEYGFPESKTGTGDIVIDFTNIAGPEDIALFDQNGNLLDYEIESLDTTAETGVLWCYNSWTRDDTVQAQVAYGNNSSNTDRQNVTGTWDNTGQNAVMVQHLNDDPLTATDSTRNNNDGTVTGATSTSGQFNGAGSFDGADDFIETANLSEIELSDFTIVTWFSKSDAGEEFTGLAAQADSISNHQGLFYVDEGPVARVNDNGNVASARLQNNYDDGEFHQVVGTWDESANEINTYADGDLDTASQTRVISSPDVSNEFEIGALSTESRYFGGLIDEVRVYSDIKSSAWRVADYDASPKGGQVYFEQEPATISSKTDTSLLKSLTEDAALNTSTVKALQQAFGEIATITDQVLDAKAVAATEQLTLADNLSRLYNLNRFEQVQVQEADIKQVERSLVQAANLLAQDSFSSFKSFSESITLSDTSSKTPGKKNQEALNLSDSETAFFNKSLTPAINLNDLESIKFFTQLTENTSLNDAVNVFNARFVGLTEAVNVSDFEQVLFRRKFSESAAVDDNQKSFTALERSDNINVSDAQKTSVLKTSIENIVLADQIIRGAAFSEQIPVSDSTSQKTEKTKVENVNILDVSFQRTFKGLTDSIVLNDVFSQLSKRSLSEVSVLSDNSAKNIVKALNENIDVKKFFQPFTLLKNVLQPVNVSDSQSSESELFRDRTESVAVNSSQASKTSKTKIEQVAVLDALEGLNIFLRQEEAIPLFLTVSTVADLFRNQVEKPVLQAVESKKFVTSFEENITVLDKSSKTVIKDVLEEQIALTDSVQAPKGFFPKLSESITVNENIRNLEAVRGRIPDVIQILNYSLAEAEIEKERIG